MCGENLPVPDTTTAPTYCLVSSESFETSSDADISVKESEASSSDESRPVHTMTQTQTLNQHAAGLVNVLGPDEEGKLIHGLLAAQKVTRKTGEIPKCLFQEAGPEPESYHVPRSSQYSDEWMESVRMEFDRLVTVGTFAEVNEIPQGCNIVDGKWMYKWNGGSHGMVKGTKACMVAMEYSQRYGVDFYFDIFAPTKSATSNRLVAATACKLDETRGTKISPRLSSVGIAH